MVGAGEATVITRFGDLSRVITEPGLAWKFPTPVESVIPVDLRLRTTSTGLQDVGTKDGLRILVQAYVAWQVPNDPSRIRQFLRAVRNDPDEAGRQLRTLVGSSLQVSASSFDLADLIDTDETRRKLPDFERRLREQVEPLALSVYGLRIQQVGIERLTLPDATLAATVARMRAERETVAAARTAEGLRAAAEIRSAAQRDSRITVANARTQAADIEAASRQEAAAIQARAYSEDPDLYALLRSMDTLSNVVGPNTRMILRTDAAPFDALVKRPLAPVLPGDPVAAGQGATDKTARVAP
jgi:membrane protease subunit HflC